jgi:ABC-type transport system involved in cytochrome c biogenesis permease subunit
MPAPAELSDWLFTSAVGVYMLAALLCALEYVQGSLSNRFGRLGVSVTALGAALHLGSVVLRRVAVFVLLPVALLLFLAGNLLYSEAAALRSYWIAIHVSAAVMASGVFLVSGVTRALHVLAEYRSARPGRTRGTDRLPPPEFLDRLAYRSAAFVPWVCYAAYLHARATAGWRGRRAAWINLVGLAVVLFNLFFVNLVVAGLHSYAN